MKTVYYDPKNGQVQMEYESPNLVSVANYLKAGLVRLIVPQGMEVSRDHSIVRTETKDDGKMYVVEAVRSINPVPDRKAEIARENARRTGLDKLGAGLTPAEREATGLLNEPPGPPRG